MRNIYLFIIILFFFITGNAQNNPNKEILVFFKDGIVQESKTVNGQTQKTFKFTNEKLRTSLNTMGINDTLLEVALPKFSKSDTLTILKSGERIQQPDMTNLYRIKVPVGKKRQNIIDVLRKMPEVLYAEPNGKVIHHAIPSDTRFGEQWGLRNTIRQGADIHAEAAWNIYTGNANNIIAIVDGGTLSTHVDLNDKISGGDAGFGWDGHGIHVSGIAAAESNNAQGISGVDWQARIHPQRIDNVTDDAATYQAIVDAVNFSPNVHVLNNSWGLIDENGNSGRYSTTVRQAFAYAYKANRTSVVSMGNHQQTQPGVVGYPAGFGNVIAVGATNNADVIANFSAQGNHIDVCAPGVDILSTINGGYGFMSGTSMAAPHVSGIASLLKGFNPNLANDDIENIIRLSADDVNGNGFDPQYGFGRVNAERALNLLRTPNTLAQWSGTSGTIVSSSGQFNMLFMGAPGLASSPYIVRRHEVRKTINYPNQFIHIEGVWGRGVFSSGWNQANPNFGEGFCEVVPGTQTNTSVTLRTYVYEVWSITGSYLGYYPKSPSNVTFAYTVLGVPAPTISGPSLLCTESASYTLNGLPTGATVSWTYSSNLQSVYGGSNFVALRANGSGNAWVQATITSIYGTCTTPQKTVWLGIPTVPSSILGFCCNGMEFGSESIYEFTINHANNQSVSQYNWVVAGGTILEGQGTKTITVKTAKVTGSLRKYFDVSVRVGNSCGWSSYLWRSGYVTSGVGPAMFSVYPNPADNEVTISVADAQVFSETDATNEVISVGDVIIYDSFGAIKKVKKSSSSQKSITVNVSDLQKGTYLILINNGTITESHKLIIEKD